MRRGARHRDQGIELDHGFDGGGGKATRSPAMVTTSSSSFICPSRRSARLERHQQPCAVVAIDAVVLLAGGSGSVRSQIVLLRGIAGDLGAFARQ